jgi:hypothetical protein
MKKGEINDQKIDEQKHVNNEVQIIFNVFSDGCFGEIDTIFVVIMVDIDGLSRSISKGKKKNCAKR